MEGKILMQVKTAQSEASKVKGWGTMMGLIPKEIKRQALRGDRSMNNLPLDIIHNHTEHRPIVRYFGYSNNASQYHLFRCVQFGDPPKTPTKVIEFERAKFRSDTKAGGGGCSMRRCPGNAIMMDTKGTRAYCERCVRTVTGKTPCSWTSIEGCVKRINHDDVYCSTCVGFEHG